MFSDVVLDISGVELEDSVELLVPVRGFIGGGSEGPVVALTDGNGTNSKNVKMGKQTITMILVCSE
jgi:hypothetical protein